MSIKKLLRLRNRIAPNYPQTILVLLIFLSSTLLSPNSLVSSTSVGNNGSLMQPMVLEELDFYQERLDLIAGRDNSVIASLELNGGRIETLFDLTSIALSPVTQIDFIISNQSQFSNVWSNPLWRVPDGLVVRIKTRTTTISRLEAISNNIITLIEQNYNLNLSLYSVQSVSYTETLISLLAPITPEIALSLFSDIFFPYDDLLHGNMVVLMEEAINQSPDIYAFGYSLQKNLWSINKITRGAMVSLADKISLNNGIYTFNLENTFGETIVPNPEAFISRTSFRIPFIANITFINPMPDNTGASVTGSFEWLLQYSHITRYTNFNAEISYHPSSLADFTYPQVVVTNSYSDQILEDEGVLNMTYSATNIGTDVALNTSIRMPIPTELASFIDNGAEIPVMKDDLTINESFYSYIYLNLIYLSTSYEIPILDIQGWYQNTTTSQLERWQNDTEIILDPHVTIYCSSGLSSDLYYEVEQDIKPYIESVGSETIIDNFLYYGPIIQDKLTTAVNNAYSIVFSSFYENKTLFQFESADFSNKTSVFGSYLESVIPILGINETVELSWQITNIPTSSDKFGAFSVYPEYSGLYKYAVFRTVESDYKDLMLTLFALINSAGRFLSTFDEVTNTFISLGSRYNYSDINGQEYYGLTNGLNLQIGDDEAVLESSLTLEESIYRVGEQINFNLNITNFGSLDAYDIHVDIVNLKLDFLWQPTGIVKTKSFDIDEILIGEELSHEFSIIANSYIGLNTYIALISFTSDKDQGIVEIVNPWTGSIIPWIYGGEARNLVSSTLTFGILLPPPLLENQAKQAFPLPEITVKSMFEVNEEDSSLYLQYEIENKGMSPANISLFQFIDQSLLDSFEANVQYIHNEVESELTIETSVVFGSVKVTYATMTLYPGDKIIITITGNDLPDNFTVPPLIVNYLSLYEILTTDFQSIEVQENPSTTLEIPLSMKLSPSTINEDSQNYFIWSTFSSIFTINMPISNIYERITYSSLPLFYPLVSVAAITITLSIAMIISKLRNK
ncbi:MAG: hypothetical protein ACTSQ4_04775 [Candidatus Heimdallarchaeaceae archaeon]